MLQAEWRLYELRFKETAITSRARMDVKQTYLIRVWDNAAPHISGYGECALFRGLSAEDTPDYEQILTRACQQPENLPCVSSVRFGFETAIADLRSGGHQIMTDSSFTRGESVIPINGLIWMGDKATMRERIAGKIKQGFRCVKLKIGGICFDDEIDLLKSIRKNFSESDIELRVDANGAFTPKNALERLEQLAPLKIHSVEQPIKQGQWEEMARICRLSPVPVALDEELIGFRSDVAKGEMLDTIRPQYIILKPSLCGGFRVADSWVSEARLRNIGWWATSALESNIGLNAIAQWISGYETSMPQGLGTGALYTNNFSCPLRQEHDYLRFQPGESFSGVKELFS